MTKSTPTQPTDRIVSLDVLRGFAMLGILIMNIQSFAMPAAAYFNPTAYGDLTGANRWVWILSHLFADQKFMTIFSLLFGAGIVLFTSRLEDRGQPSLRLHYRRTFWLLIFGLVHAYFFWIGDILVAYAFCALVVVWFRKLSPRWLVMLGVICLAIPTVLVVLTGASIQYWPPELYREMAADFTPNAALIRREVAAYQSGWLAQMEVRVPEAFGMQTLAFFFWASWRAGGLMLVGMALYKWGVLSAQRSRRFYSVLVVAGLVVGLSIAAYGVTQNFANDWSLKFSRWGPGFLFNYWGSLFVSAGYIGLIMLWVQWGGLVRLQGVVAAVGRMALSNYFLQTIIATTIFYGHGLDLFGTVERVGQIVIFIAISIVQLVWSPIWLRYFRFGPAEWLWRTLTYWRRQPMRLSND